MDMQTDLGLPARHSVLELTAAAPVAAAVPIAMTPLTLTVAAGALILIEVADWQHATVLSDLATGLLPAATGHVAFLGRDWSLLPPVHADALRGRIGHVFRRGNWIDGLPILDNILLPHGYHTRRTVNELTAEAVELAGWLGLPGVPMGFPSDLDAGDLGRAVCIRAFLGRPALVILEEPTQGLTLDVLAPLINVIRRARDRDAAVLWFTDDRAIWTDASVPATARFRLRDTLYRLGGAPR